MRLAGLYESTGSAEAGYAHLNLMESIRIQHKKLNTEALVADIPQFNEAAYLTYINHCLVEQLVCEEEEELEEGKKAAANPKPPKPKSGSTPQGDAARKRAQAKRAEAERAEKQAPADAMRAQPAADMDMTVRDQGASTRARETYKADKRAGLRSQLQGVHALASTPAAPLSVGDYSIAARQDTAPVVQAAKTGGGGSKTMADLHRKFVQHDTAAAHAHAVAQHAPNPEVRNAAMAVAADHASTGGALRRAWDGIKAGVVGAGKAFVGAAKSALPSVSKGAHAVAQKAIDVVDKKRAASADAANDRQWEKDIQAAKLRDRSVPEPTVHSNGVSMIGGALRNIANRITQPKAQAVGVEEPSEGTPRAKAKAGPKWVPAHGLTGKRQNSRAFIQGHESVEPPKQKMLKR